MKQVTIIQLSDLHIRSGSENPLLTRIPALAGAIRSACIGSDACFIVVTGDIAYAGLATEYELARTLFESLLETLKSTVADTAFHLLSIPGNHDCCFQRNTALRDLAIQNMDLSTVDDSIVAECLAVQEDYRAFARNLSASHTSHTDHSKLHHEVHCSACGYRFSFHLLNSAWTSTLPEVPGSHLLPVPTPPIDDHEHQIRIVAIHHPYPWYEPNNGLDLRHSFESFADIILTGHMHRQSSFSSFRPSGERNEYVEGGVLQDSDDPSRCSFNSVRINMAREEFQVSHFEWTPAGHFAPQDEQPWQPFQRRKQRLGQAHTISDSFRHFLQDPGANYRHPRKRRLHLQDIFVYPTLRDLDKSTPDSGSQLIKHREVLTHILKHKQVLIMGSDKSGKTALAKTLFTDLRANSKIPLYLDGRHLHSADGRRLEKHLDQLIEEQYGRTEQIPYWQLSKAERAVLVDNYHALRLNRTAKNQLLTHLTERFEIVVLLGSDQLGYEELIGDDAGPERLFTFQHSVILEFGYVLRHELITRWFSLNLSDDTDEARLERSISEAERLVANSLGKDFVPSYPAFILILLQALDSQEHQRANNGSFGYLYEILINTAILSSHFTRVSTETKFNYLAALALHLIERQTESISEDEALRWHGEYSQKFAVRISFESLLEDLVDCGLLDRLHHRIQFRYRYIQSYFVARHIANNIDDERSQRLVDALIESLDSEEAASILICLCHTSKNPLIIEKIIQRAKSVFADRRESDLDSDLAFLGEVSKLIPNRVFDSSQRERRRRQLLERQDSRGGEPAPTTSPTEMETRRVPADEAMVLVRSLNSAFAMIQIMGQILKNFGGSMVGPRKYEVTEACYKLGLRAASAVFQFIEKYKDPLIEGYIAGARLHDDHIDDDDLQHDVNRRILRLVENLSLSIVKHISASVGAEELAPTFEDLLSKSDNAAYRLIDFSVKLDSFANFPREETKALSHDFKHRFFPLTIARDLVWLHLHLFHVNYKIKQEACSRLGIKLIGSEFNPHEKVDSPSN